MIKVSYPELFPSGNFRGRKFFLGGRVVTARFSLDLFCYLFICVYMYLYVINCLCVYFGLGLVDCSVIRVL